MKTDVLIIGGGAAGLAAACEAAERGADVVVVEEHGKLGGKLGQQTQQLEALSESQAGWRGFEVVQHLADQLLDEKVRVLLRHTVIGTYGDGSIGVSNEQGIVRVEAKAVVAATGAYERAVAFPGWTLPGVMTAGAVQKLLNVEGVYPGKKGLIVGCSELSLALACLLNEIGVQLEGIAVKDEQLALVTERWGEALSALAIPLIGYAGLFSVSEDRQRIREAVLQRADGSEYRIDLDFLAVDGGRSPVVETFSLLDCDLAYVEELGGWVPHYDQNLQTSVSGVFAAGSGAGVTCQAAVIATGRLAGLGAAGAVGLVEERELHALQEQYRAKLFAIEAACKPEVRTARAIHMNR